MTEVVNQSSTLQDAYYDRNLVVQALAKLAILAGYTVGIKIDPEEPNWPILFMDLGTGQMSWHLPKDEALRSFPVYNQPWDHHDLEEKRARLKCFIE